MSDRYQGGVIRATPLAPTSSSASGIWTMEQQAKAQAAGDWPIPPVTVDPNFNQVSMLLSGEPAGGLDYTAFSDASTNNFLITPSGNPYGTAFSPYNSLYSNYFDGNSDYVQTSSSGIIPTSGSWTVEGWIYLTGSSNNTKFLSQGTSGASGRVSMGVEGGSWWIQVGNDQITNGNVYRNQWLYFGVTFNNATTTMTFYINGTSFGSTSVGSVQNSPLTLGTDWLNYWWNGYISNLRISNIVRDVTTVPTSVLTSDANTTFLGCTSNRFIDIGPNTYAMTAYGNTAISGFTPLADTDTTTGSGYLNGSSAVLSPSSSNLALASGDFTVELWYYTSILSGTQVLFDWRPANTQGFYPTLYMNGTTLTYYTNSGDRLNGGTLAPSRWYHIALVRNSGTTRIYVNGVDSGNTYADSNTYLQSNVIVGGSYASGGSLTAYVTGNISNLRIVKGTAVYTSNFTPPTAPLTAVANTQLLTLQDRAANQNFGFLDTTKNNVITAYGNATQGTFSPFSQADGYWSNYFNGSGYTSTGNVFPLTADFCVEFWVNYSSLATPGGMIVSSVNSSGYGNWCLYYNTTSNVLRLVGTDSSTYIDSPTVPLAQRPTIGTWHHMAVSRSGSTIYWFIDGALLGTTSNSTSWSGTSSTTYIGSIDGSSQKLTGYISNLRIVRGSAVYTSAFTPSTTPLTAITNTSFLTCQSNRFKDNSSNGYTVTAVPGASVQPFGPFAPTDAYDPAVNGGSMFCDGSGDYISIPQSGPLTLENNFTLEFWYYRGGTTAANNYGFTIGDSSTANGLEVYIGNSGATLRVYSNNGIIINAGSPPANGEWMHIALVRTGTTTLTIYKNGVSAGSVTNTSTFTGTLRIGVEYYGGSITGYLNGGISDFRINNEQALYTTTFTPPTAPLTANAYTALLCNFTNAGVWDSAARNDLDIYPASIYQSNANSKFGSGSIRFDGQAQYMRVINYGYVAQNLVFGTGDFTIENWIYINSSTDQFPQWFDQRDTNPQVALAAYFNNYGAGNLDIYVNGSVVITGAHAGTDVWQHIALVRSSGSTKLYVNGAQVGSTYSDSNNYVAPQTLFGTRYSIENFLKGYIDDLRITKGVARYTTNFTPANYPFPVK